MSNIIFEKTDSSPEVNFSKTGDLFLQGRSMPEDVRIIFDPLIDFVQKLEVNEVNFKIDLNYFNTATSRKLMDLLQYIDANNNINIVNVFWHFEEGDEDSLETAEIYEDLLLRTNFKYIEYAEAEEELVA